MQLQFTVLVSVLTAVCVTSGNAGRRLAPLLNNNNKDGAFKEFTIF